jgi:hypothetical protein
MIINPNEIDLLRSFIFDEATEEETQECFTCNGDGERSNTCEHSSICQRYSPVCENHEVIIEDLLDTIEWMIRKEI